MGILKSIKNQFVAPSGNDAASADTVDTDKSAAERERIFAEEREKLMARQEAIRRGQVPNDAPSFEDEVSRNLFPAMSDTLGDISDMDIQKKMKQLGEISKKIDEDQKSISDEIFQTLNTLKKSIVKLEKNNTELIGHANNIQRQFLMNNYLLQTLKQIDGYAEKNRAKFKDLPQEIERELTGKAPVANKPKKEAPQEK